VEIGLELLAAVEELVGDLAGGLADACVAAPRAQAARAMTASTIALSSPLRGGRRIARVSARSVRSERRS
jgi:hypothetical protein